MFLKGNIVDNSGYLKLLTEHSKYNSNNGSNLVNGWNTTTGSGNS